MIKVKVCILPIKGVIFDFIGTLVCVKGYSLEASKVKMYRTLYEAGFNVTREMFMEAYAQSHEKYRAIRYQQLVEITNTLWVSDALKLLGFDVTHEDPRVKEAVNVFFEDYLASIRARRCAVKLLATLSMRGYRLGLVSNFTYAPVIYSALRKTGLGGFFNAILISADVGWRKPHVKIFEEALRRLEVDASEVIYVGDSPDEDIKGAKHLGMKTIYVASQFYPLETLKKSMHKPDFVTRSLCEAGRKLLAFLAGS
ncbi:MAG: HAD family hydrolase [Candidatus Bathyarchaeota archaeon]|nr:HAD family hydrolase [Candidatus Bathyarchaeota archaeon]